MSYFVSSKNFLLAETSATMKRVGIFNTFHDVKKTYEELRTAITRILKSGLTRNLLVFLPISLHRFLIDLFHVWINRDAGRWKRVLAAVIGIHFRNYLPSSYGRAVSSLCSVRVPTGVAASDIAPLRPNCFCYLAVCGATRPKLSRVFPASIKSTRRVMIL